MEKTARSSIETTADPFQTAELLRVVIVTGELPGGESLPEPAVERFRHIFGQTWNPETGLSRFADDFLSIHPDQHHMTIAYLSGTPEDLLKALFGSDVMRQTAEILTPATPESPPPQPIINTTYETTARRGLRLQTNRAPRSIEPEESSDTPEDAEEDELDQQLPDTRLTQDTVKDYLRQIGKVPLLTAKQEVALAKSIEAGVFAQERLDNSELSRPNQATDAELRELASIGQSSKQQMIEANLRLVVHNAKRFQGRGLSFIDLIQEGNLGLIRAIEKFDYRQGNKLSTYATWWIKQSITRAIQDQSATIRVPVHTREHITQVQRVSIQFFQTHNREPSAKELAQALDSSPEKIEELLGYMRNLHLYSLDQPLSDEEGSRTLGDSMHLDNGEPTEHSTLVKERVQALQKVINTLPERERYVIRARFGLETGQTATLQEIGDSLGLTRERARQIEYKALSKLRHPSRARWLRGLL